MNVFFRVSLLSLLAFAVFSCSPRQAASPLADPAALPLHPPLTHVTPASTEVTAQKALIFIEFFSGT